MKAMEIRYVSSNEFKIREVKSILETKGITIVPSTLKIEEIQTENIKQLVRDKLIKAFSRIGRPVFVEHTGLHLKAFNDLPGGLTQIFWDRLKADRFSSIVTKLGDTNVIAKTVIGYCDAKTIHYFEGEVKGTVPPIPAGSQEFQWDCVFVPDGYSETFAELGDTKNKISMRRKALDLFSTFLKEQK